MLIRKILFIIVILITLTSCSVSKKELNFSMRDVFSIKENTNNFVFSLDTIAKFDSIWKDNCIPFEIISKKTSYLKHKNLSIPVNATLVFACTIPTFCPKEKNMLITGYNSDSIYFHHNFDSLKLSVRNFKKVLKKQYFNNREKPQYADSPKSVLISVEYKTKNNRLIDKDLIQKKIDTIIYSYYEFIKEFKKENIDSLKIKYPLNLILMEELKPVFPNNPPPPTPIDY